MIRLAVGAVCAVVLGAIVLCWSIIVLGKLIELSKHDPSVKGELAKAALFFAVFTPLVTGMFWGLDL